MSALDLQQSMDRARARLSKRPRAARKDLGKARISPRVEAELQRLLQVAERPPMTALATALRETCKGWGETAPSRASIYNAVARACAPQYQVAALPPVVRRTLYNVDVSEIDGGQLVFHAFNYGSLEALSFASGLPWLCLQRASELRGFRPKSYALLRAVMAYRGL